MKTLPFWLALVCATYYLAGTCAIYVGLELCIDQARAGLDKIAETLYTSH